MYMEPENVRTHFTVTLSSREQWIYFLLIGCLSMLYAELFSGASQLWFFNVWSLLVTFPLYMVHVLFFFNLALRMKKTSPVHLYLFGVLFGMYESWITQVLWIGYSAEGPMVGTFLGIGIGEFLALVFFWHPILSFMLPILVFQLLILSVESETPLIRRILPSHIPFLMKTKSNQRYIYVIYVIGSAFMAVNYQGDLLLALAALGGTYTLIYLLYRKARTYHHFSVYSLRVQGKGIKIMVIYMIALYSIMFFGYGYYGGRIPGYLPIATTIVLYILFGWVVKSSNPAAESVDIPLSLAEHLVNMRDYRKLVCFNILTACGFSVVFLGLPSPLFVVFMFFYFTISVVGIYIFYKAVRLRNGQTTECLKNKYNTLIEAYT